MKMVKCKFVLDERIAASVNEIGVTHSCRLQSAFFKGAVF